VRQQNPLSACTALGGVKFGRPAKLTPHQRRDAIARLQAGEAQADVARTYGVAHTTIGRLSALGGGC